MYIKQNGLCMFQVLYKLTNQLVVKLQSGLSVVKEHFYKFFYLVQNDETLLDLGYFST